MLPGQYDFANDLLLALCVEVCTNSLVEFIHELQHGVGPEDFMANLSHQHDRALVLKDGCDETRPHLHSNKV